MLSILGGKWKGKQIEVPESQKIRPTSSKVRGAIFNILSSWQMKQGKEDSLVGLRCLDLFAGSGALGFEALSRGAIHCTMVEKNRTHSRIIEKNTKILSCKEQVDCIPVAVETWLKQKKWTSPFQLIFADPPYQQWKEEDLEKLLLLISEANILAQDGLFFLEYNPKWEQIVFPEKLRCDSTRILGPAALSVFTQIE